MTMQSFPDSRFLQYASVFLRPETAETAQSQRRCVQFVSKRVLDSLCDLQIITSTAILIAGLSQYPDITFYHEQLVISYWSLTLNSFWAAKAGDFLNDPDREIWYIRIRTAAIFCSVVLAVVYQSLLLEGRNGLKQVSGIHSGVVFAFGHMIIQVQARISCGLLVWRAMRHTCRCFYSVLVLVGLAV